MKLKPTVGYSIAGLTIVAAVLVPFVLMDFFAGRVGKLGLRVDETYVGGPVVRTIQKGGYAIQVHKEARPRLLQQGEAYVQLAWTPAAALPRQVADAVDIDGDGTPDVRVGFQTKTLALRVDVEPLNPKYLPLRNVGMESMSRMIAPVHGSVVVRIPIRK